MHWDADDLPKVGSVGTTLGARPEYPEEDIDPEDRIRSGDRIVRDIKVDADGLVQPEAGGMSVFFHPIKNIVPHRRPPKHAHPDDPVDADYDPRCEVFELETDHLPDSLRCRTGQHNPKRHAFIEPAWEMSFEDYLQALHATRDMWHPV